jgi:hypothetical protein
VCDGSDLVSPSTGYSIIPNPPVNITPGYTPPWIPNPHVSPNGSPSLGSVGNYMSVLPGVMIGLLIGVIILIVGGIFIYFWVTKRDLRRKKTEGGELGLIYNRQNSEGDFLNLDTPVLVLGDDIPSPAAVPFRYAPPPTFIAYLKAKKSRQQIDMDKDSIQTSAAITIQRALHARKTRVLLVNERKKQKELFIQHRRQQIEEMIRMSESYT